MDLELGAIWHIYSMAVHRIGSNQYRKRSGQVGVAAPFLKSPVSTVDTGRRRCGEVWGSDCQEWVTPPHYTHASHPLPMDRRDRALDPNLPSELLSRFVRADEQTRQWVAQNVNVTVQDLSILAEDKSPYVRAAVAAHNRIPVEDLVKLAEDADWRVRKVVAANPNTPATVLARLTVDKNAMVRSIISQNPHTPSSALSEMKKDIDVYVRRGLAGNANTPVDLLIKFLTDDDAVVRQAVRRNSNAPARIRAMFLLSE